MSLKWPDKDPDEVLDYSHDWSARLDGDTIVGDADCILDSGTVTIDSTETNGNIQTVWLSGGAVGKVKLTLRVLTSGGRTYDEGIDLEVKER